MAEGRPRKRKGCLFFGCIGGLVMLLLVALGGLFGLRYFKRMVNDFTDAVPIALPAVQLPAAQMNELTNRIATFGTALEGHRTTEPLSLNADEVNALIQSRPELSGLKRKLYVTIEGDK